MKLIFPNRSINSSDNIEELQKYYDFQEDFYVEANEHRLPFKGENPGKFLEKIHENKKFISKLGISGFIATTGDLVHA